MVKTPPQQQNINKNSYIPPLAKRVYCLYGIQEYIVWQVLEQTISWFSLQDGEYRELKIDAQGIIKSQVFPGLWLDVSALVTGNMLQLMTVLQTGLSSTGYQKFVKSLSAIGNNKKIRNESDR